LSYFTEIVLFFENKLVLLMMTAVIWCLYLQSYFVCGMSGICIQMHISGNFFYSTFTNVLQRVRIARNADRCTS